MSPDGQKDITMRYEKIIFVCKDNTSLSPMAESIFVSLYRGEPIYVASRGLVVLFPMPCNQKTADVLAAHDIPLIRQVSVELRESELTQSTLVIAMSDADKDRFSRRFPRVSACTLAQLAGELYEPRNPYGGDEAEYEHCFEEMHRMLQKAIARLAIEQKKDVFEGWEAHFEEEPIGEA